MQGKSWLPYLLLGFVTVAAFASAAGNQFTNWDDPAYITEYRLIRGLSWDRVVAAFSNFHVENYNPLHIVSYMVDYELWGLEPRGYVLANVVLHLAAGLLVWKVLLTLSGDRTVAGVGAVVFLVHPTRCESVVWLSERKDVLCAFFTMLTVWCNLGWSETNRREDNGTQPRNHWPLYVATVAAFVVALLSKSQVVTLPLVFVDLDIYRRRTGRGVVLDKIPLFALSAVFSIVTLQAHGGRAETVLGAGGLGELHFLRPLFALPYYAMNLVWPVGSSPVYRYDDSAPFVALVGALLLGLAVWGMIRSYRRRRVFFAGTWWFFSLLLPVSGLVSNQVLVADRYLYLAVIGLAWIAGDLLSKVSSAAARRGVLAAVSVVFACLTASYSAVWKDSASLWTRVLEGTPDTPVAQANLRMHYL